MKTILKTENLNKEYSLGSFTMDIRRIYDSNGSL